MTLTSAGLPSRRTSCSDYATRYVLLRLQAELEDLLQLPIHMYIVLNVWCALDCTEHKRFL